MNDQTMNKDLSNIPADELESIILGGGCFWCVEAVLQDVEGVYSVVSGYAGGTEKDANYTAVCTGMTGHAEVAEINFNPKVVSLEQILLMFWSSHDPTTLNRQGNDVGPQYRSAIFYNSEQQKAIAEQSKKEVATSIWDKPIVTEITPLEKFYPAEDYHQNYYKNVGSRNSYCTFVITPKVTKFRKQFADKLKKA
jgi:peptide-methionine (S)-S-oxide reductase